MVDKLTEEIFELVELDNKITQIEIEQFLKESNMSLFRKYKIFQTRIYPESQSHT